MTEGAAIQGSLVAIQVPEAFGTFSLCNVYGLRFNIVQFYDVYVYPSLLIVINLYFQHDVDFRGTGKQIHKSN